MITRSTPYLIPDTACLHVYSEEEITNEEVFDYFNEQGIEYEAREEGIVTFLQEKQEIDGEIVNLQYEIIVIPEDNYINIQSTDRLNPPYLAGIIGEEFTPGLINGSKTESTGTYSVSLPHPVIDLQLIDSVIDGTTLTQENEKQILTVTYDDVEYKIDSRFEIIPDDPDPEPFNEFIRELNIELYQNLPEPPEQFQADELPKGWASPVAYLHPPLLEDTEAYADETHPLEANDLAIDSEQTPNDDVVICMDIFTSLLYGLDTLTPDEREQYYDTYKREETLYASVFDKQTEDGEITSTNRQDFTEMRFWTEDLQGEILEFRNRYAELKHYSKSCEGYNLDSGQHWRLKSDDEKAVLVVEMIDEVKFDDLRFDHLPVWIGEVKEVHPIMETFNPEIEPGAQVTINGELLIERVKEMETFEE